MPGRPGSGRKFLFQALPIGPVNRSAPVYWANDLFLRRAISLAADMAESRRTPDPRNRRHGHARPPLSAALRTFSIAGQARLANLLGLAGPASGRAPVHPLHSTRGPPR